MADHKKKQIASEAEGTAAPILGTPASRRERPIVLVEKLPFEPLQRAVLQSAHELGWRLIDLDMLRGEIPDDPPPNGALLLNVSPALHQRLSAVGCSLVEIQPLTLPKPMAWPVVAMDLPQQGRLAADHFFERGFRHVAYVDHDPWSGARPIYDGFLERADELGIACGLHQLKSAEQGEKVSRTAFFRRRERRLTDWLRNLPKPVGVLTYSDTRAGMICIVARRAGLLVPEEIAILGRSNDPYVCEVSPVPLSSIDVGHREMGRQAVRLLQHLMQGESGPAAPILIPPGRVIERQSTDVLATPDPRVAAALRYMWDHLDLDLSVDDVAGEVGISRRHLERLFRACLDRGVTSELQRKRLAVFHELLTTTDVPISELAPSVGFRTMVHLRRSFRRAYGMSPQQYRSASVRTA